MRNCAISHITLLTHSAIRKLNYRPLWNDQIWFELCGWHWSCSFCERVCLCLMSHRTTNHGQKLRRKKKGSHWYIQQLKQSGKVDCRDHWWRRAYASGKCSPGRYVFFLCLYGQIILLSNINENRSLIFENIKKT